MAPFVPPSVTATDITVWQESGNTVSQNPSLPARAVLPPWLGFADYKPYDTYGISRC